MHLPTISDKKNVIIKNTIKSSFNDNINIITKTYLSIC